MTSQEIKELIQRRRLQMLVHSCIYYELNGNLVSDKTWDRWAKELVDLQSAYPDISKQVIWYDAFKDWDGSTGAFLPLDDEWVVRKAMWLSGKNKQKLVVKQKSKKKGALF